METCKINKQLAVALSMSLLFVTLALATADVAAGESLQATTTAAAATSADPKSSSSHSSHLQSAPSLRRVARALARYGNGGYKPRPPMSCDKFPNICRAQESPWAPDCCGKRCVNTKTDSYNCGRCGVRCWYGSVCCGGRCVGIMYDRNNCGRCGNKCKKGSYCRYGMCSYGY